MNTEKRIFIAHIHIWTAVFTAVLFCMAFSLMVFADGDVATITAGDKVVIGKFTGTEIKLDGIEYKFIKQDDILAVVTD